MRKELVEKIADKFTDTFYETITDYIHIYFDGRENVELDDEEVEAIYEEIITEVGNTYFITNK